MAVKNYSSGSVSGTNVPSLAVHKMLERADAFTYYDAVCDDEQIESQTSATPIFARWINPAVNDTPETEGVTPISRMPQHEDYTGTMQRYSEIFTVTTYDRTLSPWDAVEGSVELLETLIKSTRERIRMNAAFGGTNVFYNSSAVSVRTSVNGPLTYGRIQEAIAVLQANKAKAFTGDQTPSNKYGTTALEAGFYFLHHTDQNSDIRAMPGFVPRPKMADKKGLPEGTWGGIDNVLFIGQPETQILANAGGTNAAMKSTGGTSIDVYRSFLCGMHTIKGISLRGKSASGFGNLKVTVLDGPDKSDPTNTRVVIAGAWMDLAILVSNDWSARFETGATAHPA